MLIAARSSQDFACCARATASARSKYASAFVALDCGAFRAIFPAIRVTSASCNLSLVFSISVSASSMQRQASSSWPRSAWAAAKYDNHNGNHTVDPVDRSAASPEVVIWSASEALSVRAKM